MKLRTRMRTRTTRSRANKSMQTIHPIFASWLAGFLCSLVISSIPFGPINLTILNEGARRGFRWALLIGLGAASMECVYCALSFTGFSSFCANGRVKTIMEVFTCVFLVFIGIKFLTAKTVHTHTKLDVASEKLEARLEEKLRPHSAYATGLVRVMGNLGVLLFWIVWAAYLLANDWVDDTLPAKTACVGGVLLGTSTWFVILSFGVSRGHGQMKERTMMRLQHFSGICLIVFGLAQLALQLTGVKIHVPH
jgi:threonine/homoserine/homoserine lactone efflux protein